MEETDGQSWKNSHKKETLKGSHQSPVRNRNMGTVVKWKEHWTERSRMIKDGFIYENGARRPITEHERLLLDDYEREVAIYNQNMEIAEAIDGMHRFRWPGNADADMRPSIKAPQPPCICSSCYRDRSQVTPPPPPPSWQNPARQKGIMASYSFVKRILRLTVGACAR
uniref:Uncharacterized protein n=1 Tax=Ascaris lumbricoides TaxID=6252 RepID=A0A9J2PXY4_ASCLU